MATTIFTPCTIAANGVLIARATSIETDEPDNDTNVETILGGVEGPAPGAAQVMVTLNEVIPQGGSTFDWHARKRERATVQIKIQQIGPQEKMEGSFLVASIRTSSSSSNPTAKDITLKSVGTPAPTWQ